MVEPLEMRCCLAAPVIMGFQATVSSNRYVYLTGSVADESPANLPVQFSGVLSGQTTTNSNGQFTFFGEASALGTINASVVDGEGLASGPASATVSSTSPTISNLTITESGWGKTVQVSGTVGDESPSGRTVSFSGIGTGSATTSSNGQFFTTLSVSSLGNLTATVTDPWGLQGTAQGTATSAAPVIENFSATTSSFGKYLNVTGRVIDAAAGYAKINLGGISSGNYSVNSDGTFSIMAPASSLGTITAAAVDIWGQNSVSVSVNVTDAAPVIDSLNATLSSYGKNVTLSGHVTDAVAGQAKVAFSGVAGGTYTVNYNGSFSHSVMASSLGNVIATATDIWGQTSASVVVTLTDSAPVIDSFTVTKSNNSKNVTISGHITDVAAGQARLLLSGVASGNFSVNMDGTFSITTLASSLGTITATASDVWGQTSTTATGQITSTAPTLSNVRVMQETGEWWVIEGVVQDDETVPGLVVTFGGYLQGSTTTVMNDGTFSFGFSFTGSANTISAVVRDRWGLNSNTANVIIA